MNFYLTNEQKAIQRMARQFREREIEPIAAQIDQERKIPDDMIKKMAGVKLLGIKCPRKYGGAEAGHLGFILTLEEIGYAGSACSLIINTNNNIGEGIDRYGTEEQKEKYIRPLCEGEAFGTLAFTEAATGSDPRAITTTATPDGDYYVLNGTKRFITWGNHDGPGIFYAKDETGRISAFIVEKNTEGYSTSKPMELLGHGGQDSVDVYLKDVRVPKSNLLGTQGDGMSILFGMIGTSKLGICAYHVGLAQAALDEAVKYAKERIVRGNPIASMQSIQYLLVEMATRVEAARWFTYRSGFLLDQGEDIRKESAMTKLFVGRAAVEVADMALQVHGAYGFTKEFKVERLYRDAKYIEIIEGVNEIQRTIVAQSLIA